MSPAVRPANFRRLSMAGYVTPAGQRIGPSTLLSAGPFWRWRLVSSETGLSAGAFRLTTCFCRSCYRLVLLVLRLVSVVIVWRLSLSAM